MSSAGMGRQDALRGAPAQAQARAPPATMPIYACRRSRAQGGTRQAGRWRVRLRRAGHASRARGTGAVCQRSPTAARRNAAQLCSGRHGARAGVRRRRLARQWPRAVRASQSGGGARGQPRRWQIGGAWSASASAGMDGTGGGPARRHTPRAPAPDAPTRHCASAPRRAVHRPRAPRAHADVADTVRSTRTPACLRAHPLPPLDHHFLLCCAQQLVTWPVRVSATSLPPPLPR